MIQIITYSRLKFQGYPEKYKISLLDEFDSFDDYDINIIDLSDQNIWTFKGGTFDGIDMVADFMTIMKEINTASKSKIVIVLPQNVNCRYNWSVYDESYIKSNKLKNVLPTLKKIISKYLFEIEALEFSYSNSKTKINELLYKSDFNLVPIIAKPFEIISKSNNSDKITTVLYRNLIITTLNVFESTKHLENFIGLIDNYGNGTEQIPDWVTKISFNDDEELMSQKSANNIKIEKLQEKNSKIDMKLSQNLTFKSILYQTGDQLVSIVMKMLDDMLEYDSSKFVDEKREDFLIKKENVTFVGEIKGISSAISNENVSQLDVHVQSYIDKITSEDITENVKGLLIINHQRKKEISQRNKVHQNQIDLAIRNKSLIIESTTLLDLYEMYLQHKIDSKKIIDLFNEKIGVLSKEDFK